MSWFEICPAWIAPALRAGFGAIALDLWFLLLILQFAPTHARYPPTPSTSTQDELHCSARCRRRCSRRLRQRHRLHVDPADRCVQDAR
ncbi:hypothetical protein PF008_g28762, partial [Phytophthora fragariae]